MQYDIKFNLSDDLGTWESNWCNFFDCDEDAITWAKEEIKYFRKRWEDLVISGCILVESFIDKVEDRFICNID